MQSWYVAGFVTGSLATLAFYWQFGDLLSWVPTSLLLLVSSTLLAVGLWSDGCASCAGNAD